MIPAAIISLLRIILAALFLFSGIAKMFDLRGFSIITAKFGMLPRQLVKPFAYALPFVEVLLGLWLLSNRMLYWSSLGAIALMVVSEIGIAGALIRQKKIENCGCFGPALKVPVTWRKFAENLIWLAMAVLVFLSTIGLV
jgi:uncharacterized membrane protein YphA (DoxX/SURF4 family)